MYRKREKTGKVKERDGKPLQVEMYSVIAFQEQREH
jgi:hypothetical protein